MSQPSWIGSTLSGRYKIEELIGQGGMSSVYKGIDPNLKRVVAIKLIHPHLTGDDEFVRRFEVEASAVAQLRHPNIIQVFDFNSDGDTYYMVLEFVPGETLQARLKRLSQTNRRLSLEEIVEIGSSVSGAAHFAHQRGLIHRDIKPANVMLNVQGEAILMDFGITKIVGATQHTATGAVIGTALYMSPEQIRGEQPDHRVDVYSLGVMLFEMTAGRVPYESDSAMTIMMMHLNDPIPNLNELRADTPPELRRIIEKALAKDQQDRYQTADELSTALQNVLHAPQAAPPIPVPEDVTTLESALEPEATVVDPVPTPPPQAGAGSQPPGGSKPGVIPPTPMPAKRGSLPIPRNVMIGGGAVIGLLFVIFLVSQLFGGSRNGETEPTAEPSDVAVVILEDTPTAEEPSKTPPPPTETSLPTKTPLPSATPTPDDLYANIKEITLQGNIYAVDYETFNYTETLPGMHIHFFFDTVIPSEAGAPGSGPWILYGGPRPFTGYTTNNKPAGATKMCALVANSNHSLYALDTGNCVELPTS